MRFLDEAVITVVSGNGGRGCVSFRREKYVPRGGPNGGDGGDGGNIWMRGSSRLPTLGDYRSRKYFKAQNGAPGRGKNQSGKNGSDVMLEVPLGTAVYHHGTGELLADLVGEGQEVLVLPGGKGGKGNQHFATPTNRAPRIAQPGEPGQETQLRLSLKYLADVGIIGLPNSGKSTLLSRLTMARPRIDDYPFSTLAPNLGVMTMENGRNLTVADIPGLIKGACQGRGLGHRFLKHVERTKVLLHLLDFSAQSPKRVLADFHTLRKELGYYDAALLHKDQIVLLNKIDLFPSEKAGIQRVRLSLKEMGHECLAISALTGDGLDELKKVLERKFENG